MVGNFTEHRRALSVLLVCACVALSGARTAAASEADKRCKEVNRLLAEGSYRQANFKMHTPGLSESAPPCDVRVSSLRGALRPETASAADDAASQKLLGAGRYEFIGNIGVAATYDGVLLMAIAEPDSAAPFFLVPATLGALAMVGAADWTADGSMTRGMAAAIRSGGWIATAEVVLAVNADLPKLKGTAFATALLVAQLAGTGLGYGVARQYAPTDGQVAMVNSGAMWGTIGAIIGTTALGFNNDFNQSTWRLMLAGLNVGALGAVVLAHQSPISRSRMALIDGGAIAGGVLGAGVMVLIQGEGFGAQTMSTASLIGMVGGMVGTAMLTQESGPAQRSASSGLQLQGPGLTLLSTLNPADPLTMGARLVGGRW